MNHSFPSTTSKADNQLVRKATRHMSCEFCRSRKIRCTREAWCRNCREKGIVCVWLRSAPSRTIKESQLTEAEREITRLRALVFDLTDRLKSLVADSLQGSSPSFKVYSDPTEGFEYGAPAYPTFTEYYDVASDGTSYPDATTSTSSSTSSATFSNVYPKMEANDVQPLLSPVERYDPSTPACSGHGFLTSSHLHGETGAAQATRTPYFYHSFYDENQQRNALASRNNDAGTRKNLVAYLRKKDFALDGWE